MKPIVLAIVDGVGIREEDHGNAFNQADKPFFDYLMNEYPISYLEASGKDVGLPEGQMGNSEVGHLNIGAGRVVYQPLELINEAIVDESIYENQKLLGVIDHVNQNNTKLHVIGLLSDGGVHSHLYHILAMLKMAKKNNIKKMYFHVITDGRDTYPDKGYEYYQVLAENINSLNLGKIATVSGRYYAMDRDKRWDRTKLAYDAMVNGIGKEYKSVKELFDQSYHNGKTDEFIIPSVFDQEGIIEDNDGIIFANFRPDRATQILTALTNPDFKDFVSKKLNNIKLVSLMPCAESIIGDYAFKLEELHNTLGIYLSNLSYKQLRIAETEKYAHVTYFFDGGKELALDGCSRILIESPKVATYDLKPEMSAYEVTDKLLAEIDSGKHDLIILNYANLDMVGHTGNIEAAIKAVEVIDKNLGRIYEKIKEKEGLLIITADHGNCEYMLDKDNKMVTSHTTNKVPFIVCNKNYSLKNGKLGDIAPTILKIMKIDIPKEMTGDILIK